MEIEFDDEVCALIVLASLLNSWETMRMVVSNFAGKRKKKITLAFCYVGKEIMPRTKGEI